MKENNSLINLLYLNNKNKIKKFKSFNNKICKMVEEKVVLSIDEMKILIQYAKTLDFNLDDIAQAVKININDIYKMFQCLDLNKEDSVIAIDKIVQRTKMLILNHKHKIVDYENSNEKIIARICWLIHHGLKPILIEKFGIVYFECSDTGTMTYYVEE